MEIEICNVFYDGVFAGALSRAPGPFYYFAYSKEYLKSEEARPLSISLPLRAEPFESSRLFPFFEGLLSEGWLKRVQSMNQKIDELDNFTLLARNGRDLIGAVSVELVK